MGATQCDLCPLAAVLLHMALRGATPGPLFQMVNGAFLTQDRFVAEISCS